MSDPNEPIRLNNDPIRLSDTEPVTLHNEPISVPGIDPVQLNDFTEVQLTGDGCLDTTSLLRPYLDGELLAEHHRTLASHLEACPTCQSAYRFETNLQSVVRTRLQTQAPDALRSRIIDTLGL